jgi:hypothetical protein
MRFVRLFILGLLASLLPLSSLAKVYHGSLAVHGSRSSRPYYGGGKHTASHGGQYPGSTNQHHKNGHYRNPRTGADQYGKHKP